MTTAITIAIILIAYSAFIFLIWACCRVAGDADARAEQFERQLPGNGADEARVGANNSIHNGSIN